MLRSLFAIGVVLAAGVLPGVVRSEDAPVVPPRKGDSETIQLIGKDLTGWVGHKSKYWSLEDGEIVGRNSDEIKVSTYLLTERKFSDFRLTFEFKLAQSEMHSGLALWGRLAPEQGDEFTYAGHLVMFPSGYGFYDLYGRKMIHQNKDKATPLNKQHDWNRIEILAQGNRLRFALNGTLVSDWREPLPERIHEAPIGLQLHSNKVPQEVRFRKLILETFPEDRLVTVAADKQQAATAPPPARSVAANTPGLWTTHSEAVVPDELLAVTKHQKHGLTTSGIRDEEREAFYALLQKVSEIEPKTMLAAATEFRERRRTAPENKNYASRPAHEFPVFVDLYKHPEAWHGKLITLRGHLRKLIRIPAGKNHYGIENYYECWLYDEEGQNHPAVVVCLDRDDRLKESTETVIDHVAVTGYFFKNYGYEAQDTTRFAPLLVAGRLDYFPPATGSNPFRLDRQAVMSLLVAGVALVVLGRLSLRLWRAAKADEGLRRESIRQVVLPTQIDVPDSAEPAPTIGDPLVSDRSAS